MNSDELQNLAIFEQTSFDKKLAGEKHQMQLWVFIL
jgi:hypothetical protein